MLLEPLHQVVLREYRALGGEALVLLGLLALASQLGQWLFLAQLALDGVATREDLDNVARLDLAIELGVRDRARPVHLVLDGQHGEDHAVDH